MKDRVFVREVAERFGCDEPRAEILIFAVFQELRDRLTPDEAADAAAQLPTSLKMLWISFDYLGRGVRRVDGHEFLEEVQRTVGLEDVRDAEVAVVCVFRALQEALSSPTGLEGEARHVFSQLPSDLKELWLVAVEEAPCKCCNSCGLQDHRRGSTTMHLDEALCARCGLLSVQGKKAPF